MLNILGKQPILRQMPAFYLIHDNLLPLSFLLFFAEYLPTSEPFDEELRNSKDNNKKRIPRNCLEERNKKVNGFETLHFINEILLERGKRIG
mgnify:CR=1 FL=1